MAIQCMNGHLKDMNDDFLFHLGFSSIKINAKADFSGIKVVCLCGSIWRVKRLAEYFNKELGLSEKIVDLIQETDRYDMYKVGPVLCVSHGIGTGSMAIVLHEIIKLLHYAKAKDVIFIRIGTCGGLGLQPGSIVVTSEAVNGLFQPYLEMHILGKVIQRSSKFDAELCQKIMEINSNLINPYNLVVGRTMCAKDFYEEQGRLDGAICEYTLNEKKEFLTKAKNEEIHNIEMESLVFGAVCNKLKLKAAVICVTLLDRMISDQILISPEEREEFEDRPSKIIAELLKNEMKM